MEMRVAMRGEIWSDQCSGGEVATKSYAEKMFDTGNEMEGKRASDTTLDSGAGV